MIYIDPSKQWFHLYCETFSYVLYNADGTLLNLYWGAPLAHTAEEAARCDLSYLLSSFPSGSSFELENRPFEVPAVGTGWFGDPAVRAVNEAGDDLTQLTFESAAIVPGKPALPGLPSVSAENETAETLELTLRDSLTGLQAVLSYTITAGTLERHMVLTNNGTAPLTLTHMASASAPVPFKTGTAGNPSGALSFAGEGLDVIHLRGAWARERRPVRTSVGLSTYKIESQRGASGHEENPFIALAAPTATETSGEVWAMNLVYSGSFAAEAQVKDAPFAYLSIGLNPMTHRWCLAPGESFVTPEAVLVYSAEGLGGMSHLYHKLYRNYLGHSPWRFRERPVLINNWEATYFNLSEEKILAIAGEAKKLGVELMVMDDGWFGNRFDDHRALGDWVENREKLPNGLKGLAEKVNALGMMFGLWFEPEMISPDSDLYRAHPDWCLHVNGRRRTEGRNQLILDVSRKDVQDFMIAMMKRVLSSANIQYVKWDMNRNMTEAFSSVLPAAQKMETQHRYMLGLYRVLQEVTDAFPEVLFESCSGGGGRFDAGMLYYMPQTWTSDDTDAVERLKIQYGTSYVYPASAMGAHISIVPNHQVGRVTPMKTRGEVALGGNFGLELDPAQLSEEDKKEAAALIARAKTVRSLTANGRFDRLISPFVSNYCAWQFSDDDRVLLLFAQVLAQPNYIPQRVYLTGLYPAALYEDEDGRLYSGAALMQAGLPMEFARGDYQSRTILLTKRKD